jgi:hypothetical protein
MTSIHQGSAHRHHRRFRNEPSPIRSVPFFEFMLYGSRSYAAGHPAARFVCVSRGRSLTLVEAPGIPGQ